MPDNEPTDSNSANCDTRKPKATRSALFLIFVTVFIDLLGFGIVMPLLPRYARAFDTGDWMLGMLMASFSAMQFFFAPVWGRISDRVGRRPVLLIGLAGSAVFYALFGYASSMDKNATMLGLSAIAWIFVGRIGAGIAGATIPTAQAYIADSTEQKSRTKGMALIGAAFGIGFTFGPLIGAVFVKDTDPAGVATSPSAMPGYVAAALSGLAFLWALAKLPESLKPGQSTSAGHFHLARLGKAFTHQGVRLVLLTMFVTTFAFAQFESTLSLLTAELNLSDRDNFYIFAYVGFILALSQGMLIRRLATKIDAKPLALLGTIVMVIGLGLIGFAGQNQSLAQLMCFVPIATVGFSATTPALQSLLSLKSTADEQGEVLGIGQSMSALARILGPVAGMRLFGEHTALPYWAGAGLMAVGVLLVALLTPPSDQKQESDE